MKKHKPSWNALRHTHTWGPQTRWVPAMAEPVKAQEKSRHGRAPLGNRERDKDLSSPCMYPRSRCSRSTCCSSSTWLEVCEKGSMNYNKTCTHYNKLAIPVHASRHAVCQCDSRSKARRTRAIGTGLQPVFRAVLLYRATWLGRSRSASTCIVWLHSS